MSKDVLKLVKDIQHDPELIEVGARNNPVTSVTQHIYSCPTQSKMRLLLHVLEAEKMECVLIFSRTKHGADKISHQLHRHSVLSAALHSNRTQAQRQSALAQFKAGTIRVLVATDIAARGIDVEGISHVINFDTPRFAEDYVHRIGRTGRASAVGDALTFVSNDERDFLNRIARFTRVKMEAKLYRGFDYAAALQQSISDPQKIHSEESRGRHKNSAPEKSGWFARKGKKSFQSAPKKHARHGARTEHS
jgi:ATP-dependent RNA helicase RhlE